MVILRRSGLVSPVDKMGCHEPTCWLQRSFANSDSLVFVSRSESSRPAQLCPQVALSQQRTEIEERDRRSLAQDVQMSDGPPQRPFLENGGQRVLDRNCLRYGS